MLCIPAHSKRTLQELQEIPVTPRGGRSNRWLGVSHYDLLDTIFTECDKLDLPV